MHFRQDETGKQMFQSLDSRELAHNPMCKAFKAKSFTDIDIVFHFCLLDLLADGGELTVFSRKRKEERKHRVFPVKVYLSTQTGRQYVLGYHEQQRRPIFFRLDGIRCVKAGESAADARRYQASCSRYAERSWGGAAPGEQALEHFEMTIHAEPTETFIPERLVREGRQGTVVKIDDQTWHYTVHVYDAAELLPWVRTFFGRIQRLECSNSYVLQTLREDLRAMAQMYEGEGA